MNAYRLIGYDPGIDYSFIEENRRLRKRHPEIVASVIQQITALGAQAVWNDETELLDVNDEMRVSIVLCRHTADRRGFVALADPAGCQRSTGHHDRRADGRHE